MSSSLAVVALGALVQSGLGLAAKVPSTAQVVDWKSFNVLENVLPPAEANDSTVGYLSNDQPALLTFA